MPLTGGCPLMSSKDRFVEGWGGGGGVNGGERGRGWGTEDLASVSLPNVHSHLRVCPVP